MSAPVSRAKVAAKATATTSTTPAKKEGAEAEKAEVNPADIKVILLGDSAVGKSKLVERFLMDDFEPQQMSTFALTVFRHNADIDGEKVKVDFWDTAGQERFNSMHPSYYHRAHACVLVFDVTRRVTYENLKIWYNELHEYRPDIPTFVVANKIDVDMKVTKKTFAFPTEHKCPFFFCSAADGTNVVKVFTEAIKAGIQFRDAPATDFTEEVMRELDYFDKKEKAQAGTAASSSTTSTSTAPAKSSAPAKR